MNKCYLAGTYAFITAQGRVKIGSPNMPMGEWKGMKGTIRIKKKKKKLMWTSFMTVAACVNIYPHATWKPNYRRVTFQSTGRQAVSGITRAQCLVLSPCQAHRGLPALPGTGTGTREDRRLPWGVMGCWVWGQNTGTPILTAPSWLCWSSSSAPHGPAPLQQPLSHSRGKIHPQQVYPDIQEEERRSVSLP